MAGWRASGLGGVAAFSCGGAAPSVPAERVPLTDARRLQLVVTPLREPTYRSLIDPDVRDTLLQKRVFAKTP